ncbi:MAG: alkaline phosphatase family protein, partial [Phycisphaeraceae bacterium]
MGTTRAQYLAMSELESMIVSSEMNAAEATRATEPRPLQKLLLDLYKFQDEQIGRLIDELKPEHWIVLADHGSVPMHYKLNLNAFLRRHGFQAARKNAGLKSAVKKVARLVVPRSMRKSVGKKANKIITAIGNDTDWEHTRAFSHRFYGGIYVNDRERFGGLAISKEETDRLTDEIVQAINNDPEAKKHRLSARPFRREHADNPRQQTFPDVFVEAPDGYFFEYFGQAVERNHNYGPIDSILEATNDMYTGMKGKHPIFCVSESLAGHIRDGDPDDLRLAYRIVERQFADESVE